MQRISWGLGAGEKGMSKLARRIQFKCIFESASPSRSIEPEEPILRIPTVHPSSHSFIHSLEHPFEHSWSSSSLKASDQADYPPCASLDWADIMIPPSCQHKRSNSS
ncbi:hypothetical protein TWF569_004449 [Orbilia oligospora]|uniref:Uncharacterized protein n=1 Tax=Orbilia oligospora TaxID=2813651 RepID=A0A7C8J391_ORBOL|nr:hypothetical protein TWF102_011727 [Orbilia oligospora]KAF3088052.1 hypothetical protein TWF103_001241 [Orbilia oligospora]KAF3119073.1 hypothetical protein TWF569_004449 [Orbilia oligospora]KAF3123778.1 hypothetical protein TWF594_002209 [Orbilia oligospora]